MGELSTFILKIKVNKSNRYSKALIFILKIQNHYKKVYPWIVDWIVCIINSPSRCLSRKIFLVRQNFNQPIWESNRIEVSIQVLRPNPGGEKYLFGGTQLLMISVSCNDERTLRHLYTKWWDREYLWWVLFFCQDIFFVFMYFFLLEVGAYYLVDAHGFTPLWFIAYRLTTVLTSI